MQSRTFAIVCLSVLVAVAGCSRSAQTHFDRGQEYQRKDDTAAAVLEYRSALEKDPRLAVARVALAELYIRQGNGPGALAEYVRAADLLPKDTEVQLKAGALLLAAGKPDDAKARADLILAASPTNAKALILRASALAGLSDLDGAIAQVQESLKVEPSAAGQVNLGFFQLAKGRRDEAEVALRAAVAADPTWAPARVALGRFLWGAGRIDDAEAAFKTALAADANDIDANRMLASLYASTGRQGEAEPYLKKAAGASDSPAATLALVNYYVSVKRTPEALAILDKLKSAPGAWALARTRAAAIQHGEGNTPAALRTLKEVLERQPANSEARVLRGRLLLLDGKVTEALVDAQQAVQSSPRSPDAHFLLGVVQQFRNDIPAATAAVTEVTRLNPRSADAQARLAALQLRSGSVKAATDLAEQAVRNDPRNLQAGLVLVRSLVAAGSTERASMVNDQLLKGAPMSGAVHAQAGLLALSKEDASGARAAFERALTLDARLVEPLAGLTTLDIREGHGDRARARIDARLKSAPRESAVLVLASQTWEATGDQAMAEQFLRRAIDADASNFDAYGRLAQLYGSQGRLGEALIEYDKLSGRQPNSVGPPTLAALILQAQGKTEEARQRFERIIGKSPRAAVASNNLAWIYASRDQQLDRALGLAQAAKAEMPDDPDVNDTLALVYIKKQLGSLAVPLLKQALAKRPEEPVFHYHLGIASAEVGDEAGARASLERALKLSADFDGAEDARQRLRSLN